MSPPPFSDYVRMLIFHGQPTTASPLEPRKMFYKTIKYQDSLQVNNNGHAFAGGSIGSLAMFDKASTASPILYATTAYDPTSITNTTVGGWNTAIIGDSGCNVTGLEVTSQYVLSAHIKVSLTGVSNLNKQGQIHMFEDTDYSARYGPVTDTTQNNVLLNEYPIQDLPKCTHYKRIDIMNMDSDSVMEYNYIPLQHLRYSWGVRPLAYSNPNIFTDFVNKNFGFILSSAAQGTTLRLEYEIVLAQEIKNDYMNNYPPIYSRIYVDPNPTLQFLQQNTVYILKTEKHENSAYTIMKEANKHDHLGFTHIKGVELYSQWHTHKNTKEYHIPYHNYAGPGTHVIDRLLYNKKPVNYLDEAALIHDIDYMNPYITKDQADANMANNLAKTGAIASALATRLVLKLFNGFGNKEGNYSDYKLAKSIATNKKFINSKMQFTKYKV